MPAADDIAEYLEDNAYGTVGTDIFIGWFPDQPDALITVTPVSGMAPLSSIDYEWAGFQVRVRNTTYAAAWTTANNILNLLHRLTHTTIEGRVYERVEATGSVLWMGQDAKNRTEFSVTFVALKAIE